MFLFFNFYQTNMVDCLIELFEAIKESWLALPHLLRPTYFRIIAKVFLYLTTSSLCEHRNSFPELQFNVYKKLLKQLGNQPIDKQTGPCAWHESLDSKVTCCKGRDVIGSVRRN